MCLIQIYVQCADRFFEILPEEVDTAELAIEDLVSHILIDMFEEEVTVDDVTIKFTRHRLKEQSSCSISIQAHCPITSRTLCSQELESRELILEERFSNSLLEFFWSVDVETVSIRPRTFVLAA